VTKTGFILCLTLLLSSGLIGCATANSTRATDVRAKLLAAAERSEPDFPDGRSLVLTHFSHVGQLVTARGETIYVASRHSVTADVLAPHGQAFITFFDEKFHYLGRIAYGESYPLLCEGSKLYLSGDLDRRFWNSDLDRQLENVPPGNVIDVAGGFEKLTNYHAHVYGSSGGIEDAPNHPSILPLRYRNAQYSFTFFLPASWRGYSVLVEQCEANERDSVVPERGPKFVFRHPQWKAGDPYQDIPIMVFTRSQWESTHHGEDAAGAGGLIYEVGHNHKYVFGIHGRFNADDSVHGWKEATYVVERNRAANEPHLYPQ